MKLISKFHDYYDTALGHGRDDSIVYVRDRTASSLHLSKDILPWLAPLGHGATAGSRTVSIRDRANHPPSPYRWHVPLPRTPTNWRFDEVFVLVAGKAYPVWASFGCEEELLGNRAAPAGLGAVDLQSLVHEMTRQQEATRTFKEPQVEVVRGRADEDKVRAYDTARARFLDQDFTSLHLSLEAPVLLLADINSLAGRSSLFRESQTDEALRSNVRVIRNPRLADLGFARTLDPFSCFQQIGQFIGGVVPGQQMPMVEISDKSKIEKKGFDPKYGFRTRPTSKV